MQCIFRHLIAFTDFDLGLDEEETIIFRSLLSSLTLEVDTVHKILVATPWRVRLSGEAFVMECCSIKEWHESTVPKRLHHCIGDLFIQFPRGYCRDINEEVNDWYWRNAHGSFPPDSVLLGTSVAWSAYNPFEWFSADPALPGVIDAMWEIYVTLISSFSMIASRVSRTQHKFYLHTLSYDQFSHRRALATKAWPYVRAAMLPDVLSGQYDPDISSSVPDLCR